MASAFSRIASFARRDHRYVLLGTSAIAAIGMMLSSQPRSPMSFLARAFTVELVMYYLLVAWIVLSAVALVFKFTHWKTYAQTAPFTKPGVVRALRLGSYVIWAMVAILVVDRVVLGFASAWAAAASATSMPKDMLVQVLYMFQQGKQTYIAGVVTTIELAVFGTVIAFFLAIIKVVFPQGIKFAIPGLSNELVINIKDSSVLSVIGVFDLTFAASTVAGIYYKQLNAYLVAAVAYLIMTAIASWLLGRLSRRLNVKSKPLGSTSDAKPLSLGTEA